MSSAEEINEVVYSRDVAVVGEYTTPSGPVADDHFLVVVFRSGKFVELPSGNAGQMIADLEKVIGMKIELKLCNRTDASSRVIFPSVLEGKPLFDFAYGPSGFLGLMKIIRNFGVSEVSAQLTAEVTSYLGELAGNGASPTGQSADC